MIAIGGAGSARLLPTGIDNPARFRCLGASMNWVLVGVFAYIILQLVVGVAVSRRVRSESDYLIAGRSLGLGLALGAESIFELVQQANGMGSAGILVLVAFGLFSRRGAARAGYATLTVGLAVWGYGTWIGGWSCPYLLSLLAAVSTFGLVAWVETRTPRGSAGR